LKTIRDMERLALVAADLIIPGGLFEFALPAYFGPPCPVAADADPSTILRRQGERGTRATLRAGDVLAAWPYFERLTRAVEALRGPIWSEREYRKRIRKGRACEWCAATRSRGEQYYHSPASTSAKMVRAHPAWFALSRSQCGTFLGIGEHRAPLFVDYLLASDVLIVAPYTTRLKTKARLYSLPR
jgi:hypothetical protein